ncbi:MAG: hypothetical protein ACR2HA_06820 [Nocardioides sp.]
MPRMKAMKVAAHGAPVGIAVTSVEATNRDSRPAPATVSAAPAWAGLVLLAVVRRRPRTAARRSTNPAVAIRSNSANTGMFVTVPSSRCGFNNHSPSTPIVIKTPAAAAA